MKAKIWVAGIGASAGGLEASLALLENLPISGPVAYILAQHQPGQGSSQSWADLLSRTSRLPVVIAGHGDPVVAGTVYLLPAGHDGVVRNQRIVLQQPQPGSFSKPSINVLFSSLAEEYGSHSIGILLSGTGSDGVLGCRAIRGRAGLTMAQQPHSARFAGMPEAAIQAGLIDQVLECREIGLRILQRKGLVPTGNLATLLERVRRATGIDFSGYKEETLRRRLHRRKAQLGLTSLDDYLGYIDQHPQELRVIQHHFLVSLSGFFRDPDCFQALQKVLRPALQGKQAVRVWTPACASGEETYSLAILLDEMLGNPARVSIVGTDLNPEALKVARGGLYQASSVKDMDPRRLERYFTRKGQQYQLHEAILGMCQFSQQDVITGQAPSDLDLISCRNLLIYLQSSLQGQLLTKFQRSLAPAGLLFIGPSESLGLVGHSLFRAIDEVHRIYRRRPTQA